MTESAPAPSWPEEWRIAIRNVPEMTWRPFCDVVLDALASVGALKSPAPEPGQDDEITLNKLAKLLAGVYPLRPSYQQIAATILTWMQTEGYSRSLPPAVAATDDNSHEHLAQWMLMHGYATGHGDSVKDLVGELDIQHAERICGLEYALTESVTLQSHYATLLNQYDGGERIIFADTKEWEDRLRCLKASASVDLTIICPSCHNPTEYQYDASAHELRVTNAAPQASAP